MAVARSVTQYYARVMPLKHDVVSGGGKVTRPVQALMNEVLAKQLGRREEGVKEGTVSARRLLHRWNWCFRGGRLTRWRVAGL